MGLFSNNFKVAWIFNLYPLLISYIAGSHAVPNYIICIDEPYVCVYLICFINSDAI